MRQVSLRHKAPLPQQIFDAVCEQNFAYWRDRYVFDTMYFEFLKTTVSNAQTWITSVKSGSSSLASSSSNMDTSETSSSTSLIPTTVDFLELESELTQLSTRFVLETLCRSRYKKNLPLWNSILTHFYHSSLRASQWLLAQLTESDHWIRTILLASPITEVRTALAALIGVAMQMGWEEEKGMSQVSSTSNDSITPARYVMPFIDSLIAALPIVTEYSRRCNQFFHVLHQFSLLDYDAIIYLVDRHDAIARLLDLYLGDTSPLSDNPYSMPVNPSTKKRVNIGETLVRPDMTSFLGLVARLLCASQTVKGASVPPPPTSILSPTGSSHLLPLSPTAFTLVSSKPFLTRLISDAISRRRGEYVNTILAHYCYNDMDASRMVIGIIVTGIRKDQVDTMRPYFRVISGLIELKDELQSTRLDILMQSLLLEMENQSMYWKPTDFCLEHLLRLSKRYPTIGEWIRSHPTKFDWILNWLKLHPTPPRQGEATLMHKPARIDPITQIQAYHPYDFAAYAPKTWPSLQHTHQQKLSHYERLRAGDLNISPIDSDGFDSDDDLTDRQLRVGQYVDALDTQSKWLVARVIDVSPDGKQVKIHFDNWHAKYDETLPMDSTRITRFGRFSNKVIIEVETRPQHH